MNQLFPVKNAEKPRILVAPLDWGLGHATRCIPLVRELLAQGADIWLAGEGAQEQLLKEEFPGLPFLFLPGYRIRYAKTAGGLTWKMIRQGPKLRRAIRDEHKWLQQAVKEFEFDAVISDNRYGLYHESIPGIFITHQLRIKSSAGKWTEKILQKRNYRFIGRFTECWVPDTAGEDHLAGELSHPAMMPPVPVKYIGHLSRLSKNNIPEKKGQLLIVLSGPEPQRSLLENIVVKEIAHYDGTATVVRGLPGNLNMIPSTGMLQFHNHLSAEELGREMQQAEFLISRSGYSTLMDAAALQKKCIFIPTPGQTEQEYLAQYLMQRGLAYCISQKEFELARTLDAARQFSYSPFPATGSGKLSSVVKDLLAQLPAPALG